MAEVKDVIHGYWIHDRVPSEQSLSKYLYLQTCSCSVCGYKSNMEKKICPACKSVMDGQPKK